MNFEPLPAGSIVKVPFAAAILARHPERRELRFTYRDEIPEICGRRIDRPVALKNARTSPGMVDFTRFIADSNNEYMLRLAYCGTAKDIQPIDWGDELHRLSCVFAEHRDYGRRPYRDTADCSAPIWRLGNETNDSGRSSVHRLELDMLASPGLRATIANAAVIKLLGGGDGRWTTEQLALAYARVLTGRMVTPRLACETTRANAQCAPQAAKAGQQLDEKNAWSPILNGMREVLQNGTGAKVFRQLAKDAVSNGIVLVAKTGTSDVDLGDGRTEKGHAMVLAAIRTRDGRLPERYDDVCGTRLIVVNLTRAKSDEKQLIAKWLKQSHPVSRWLYGTRCRKQLT